MLNESLNTDLWDFSGTSGENSVEYTGSLKQEQPASETEHSQKHEVVIEVNNIIIKINNWVEEL